MTVTSPLAVSAPHSMISPPAILSSMPSHSLCPLSTHSQATLSSSSVHSPLSSIPSHTGPDSLRFTSPSTSHYLVASVMSCCVLSSVHTVPSISQATHTPASHLLTTSFPLIPLYHLSLKKSSSTFPLVFHFTLPKYPTRCSKLLYAVRTHTFAFSIVHKADNIRYLYVYFQPSNSFLFSDWLTPFLTCP